MAVLFFTSANSIDTAHLPGPFSTTSGGVTIGSGDGPFGINTIHLANGATVTCSNLAIPAANGMSCGCGFTMATPSGGFPLWSFGPTQVAVNPDGSVIVSGGSGAGNQGFTSPSGTINFGVRNYIEISCATWTGNAGTANLYVGGVLIVSGTINAGFGQNTFGGTLTSAIIGGSGGGGGSAMVIDSIYVSDQTGSINNGPLGPIVVGLLRPVAPGTKSQWTANGAATDWQAVNNVPPDGDTAYISDNTLNDECSVELTTPSIFASVQAVSVVTDARQTVAGPRTIAGGVGNGTSQSYGGNIPLNTTYATNTTVFNDNPNNSNLAWTLGDMAVLQAAVKVTT